MVLPSKCCAFPEAPVMMCFGTHPGCICLASPLSLQGTRPFTGWSALVVLLMGEVYWTSAAWCLAMIMLSIPVQWRGTCGDTACTTLVHACSYDVDCLAFVGMCTFTSLYQLLENKHRLCPRLHLFYDHGNVSFLLVSTCWQSSTPKPSLNLPHSEQLQIVDAVWCCCSRVTECCETDLHGNCHICQCWSTTVVVLLENSSSALDFGVS